MIKVGNIFEDARVKAKPFNIPEGFVEGLEDRVSAKIGKQQERGGVRAVLKPAALLVCSFAFVLLMGYGVMALTGTTSSKTAAGTMTAEETSIEEDEIVDYLAFALSLEEINEFISSDHSNSNQ